MNTKTICSMSVALVTRILLAAWAATMMAQSVIVFDVPNAKSDIVGGLDLVVTGINGSGEVGGYFSDESQDFKQRGFVRYRDGSITLIDAPNAFATSVRSINDGGEVTGYIGQHFPSGDLARGFVEDQYGNFTVFDAPGTGGTGTDAESISNSGDVAGMAFDANHNIHGFMRATNGTLALFDPPNANATYVTGINAGGDISGHFYDLSQKTLRGFLRDHQGNFTIFDAGSGPFTATFTTGINAAREITGGNLDSVSGFILDRHGNLVPVTPAAGRAINARGDVVGYFFDLTQFKVRGFLRDRTGSITVFDAPNASDTRPVSINARGDIAGYFMDGTTGKTRGFIRFANGL
jgi:hypothetical protein